MRIVFMGSPDFSIPTLRALVEAGHDVVGVFTQPDKPKNRGMKLQKTPVKEFALSMNIPVIQPNSLRDDESFSILKSMDPELIVVTAYGKILPKRILDLPPLGCINVHASLLPKYRGAAPINWSILKGDSETGVTIMYMAEGLDTGDIIASRSTPIDLLDNAVTLYDRLAEMGAELLIQVIGEINQGIVSRVPQDDALSSYAPVLSRELSPMIWSNTAKQLYDQVRGLVPWPSAVAEWDHIRCKVWAATLTGEKTKKAPGSIVQADKKAFKIACGDGQILQIDEIQPDGKKRMTSAAFLLGHPLKTE